MNETKITVHRGSLSEAIKVVGESHIAECKDCIANAIASLASGCDVLVSYETFFKGTTTTTQHIIGTCNDK